MSSGFADENSENIINNALEDSELRSIIKDGKSLNAALMRCLAAVVATWELDLGESVLPTTQDSNADLINKLAYCFGFGSVETLIEEMENTDDSEQGPTGDPVPVTDVGEASPHE